MRFCKDCWFFWDGKEICTNREISSINLINDTPVSLAKDLRGKDGKCSYYALYWRPKAYSPNKIYKFAITCPDCRINHVYDLSSQDSGTRMCPSCEKKLWLPEYGVNTISRKLIQEPAMGWDLFNELESLKNVKIKS